MFTRPDKKLTNICLSDDLKSFDPYDVWKTKMGLIVKNTYNHSKVLGSGPALLLSLVDQLLNNGLRLGYKTQEYPIVRALACQTLLKEYTASQDETYLIAAKRHLLWLEKNTSKGFSGACWGLGFKWPAGVNLTYQANTPHSTHSPYALEAFHLYTRLTGDQRFLNLIQSCFHFYDKDLYTMYEDANMMATSYGPFKDRIATDAVSYVMYSFALLLTYRPEEREYITGKIQKLVYFIQNKQQSDGSWLYIPDDNNSFIDCFHSCFILKNLIKTRQLVHLNNAEAIIEKGYHYIVSNFYDNKFKLYRRFSKTNKLSLEKFDLYDNAEVLNLAKLMGDEPRVKALDKSIKEHFTRSSSIYSTIDVFGKRRNKNTLRWATMPYLYALSTIK